MPASVKVATICHPRAVATSVSFAIRYSEHLAGDGRAVFEQACKLGLEGIVSKRLNSPYRSSKSKSWLKLKNPKAPGYLRHAQS